MTAIFQWGYFSLLVTILCLPTLIVFLRKRLYDNPIEKIVKSVFVGFFQFFAISYLLFFCKVPINPYGWMSVYLLHVSITVILSKYIRCYGSTKNKRGKLVFGRPFWVFIIFVGIFLACYFFQVIRGTVVYGDSATYWFLKGWALSNVQDIFCWKFLPYKHEPLLVSLIYSFFLQLNCGLGIAGYTPLLLIGAILMTLEMGWAKAGKLSLIMGFSGSMFLPILFHRWILTSHADIPLSIVYYIALMCLIDTLFYSKSFYPAMVLFLAVVMIRCNGLYLLTGTIFVSVIFILQKPAKMKKGATLAAAVFALPLLFLVGLKMMLYTNSMGDRITGMVFPAICDILQASNPLTAFLQKLHASVSNFIQWSIKAPRNAFFLFPFYCLLIFRRLSNENRFLLLNVVVFILVTVCIVYTLSSQSSRVFAGMEKKLFIISTPIFCFVYLAGSELLAGFRLVLSSLLCKIAGSFGS
jgi:hypothetical protein